MRIIYNAIETPDGTTLVSRHTHDYVSHVDTVTGETYILDGGLDYIKTSVNKVPALKKTLYIEDGIEKIRDYVAWGTRGKSGKDPITWVPISALETDHIHAILKGIVSSKYYTVFTMELAYRKLKGI